MNQNMINYSRKASMDNNDKTFRDAIMQSMLLDASGPKHNIPLTWLIKQLLLQKRQNFITKMYLDNPNHNLLLETGFILKTQAILAMAYLEKSLCIDHLKRRMDDSNNRTLEIHIQHDDTLHEGAKQDDTLDKGGPKTTCEDENKKDRSQQDPTHTFPCILHEILSNPEYSECITWLPHGRAWRIIRGKQFERVVIPRHFRHGRYTSFMRQVNGWGFQRITAGPDHNAYHHELFRKDSPHLCWKMNRPVSSKTNRSQVTIHHFSEMQRRRDY